MLSDKDREEIVAYKKQKAYDTLHEAEKVAGMGLWNLTGNRLYYATFHMASALLVYNGLSAHTHNGVIHPTEEEVMDYFPLTQGLLQTMEKLMDDQAKANN